MVGTVLVRTLLTSTTWSTFKLSENDSDPPFLLKYDIYLFVC